MGLNEREGGFATLVSSRNYVTIPKKKQERMKTDYYEVYELFRVKMIALMRVPL